MTNHFIKDLVERTLATYLEVFLGLVIVDAFSDGVVDITVIQTAAVAALPAALAVIKAYVARFRGDENSASLDPEVTA